MHVQTRPPLETIVIDDASADGTAEVAEHEGARVIRLKTNRGAAGARNEGIRAATGDAIALLDSDDFWEPNHPATAGSLLEENPEAAAAATAIRMVGARTGVWKGRIPEGPPTVVIREAFKDWLTPTLTTVVRRDALMAVGGYDGSERYLGRFRSLVATRSALSIRCLTRNHRKLAVHDSQVSANVEGQWFARHKFRIRAVQEIKREGDFTLADELSDILRVHWANDLQSAWDNGRIAWLKQLVSLVRAFPSCPRHSASTGSSAREFRKARDRCVARCCAPLDRRCDPHPVALT